MDLAEFLTARLDEDQAGAEAAQGDGTGRWHVDAWPGDVDRRRIEGETPDEFTIYDEGGHDEHQAAHIARHDPARVLADVAAVRAILAQVADLRHAGTLSEDWRLVEAADQIESHLARAYASHPDYNEII